MPEWIRFEAWALPAALVLGGLVIGVVAEIIVRGILRKMAAKTSWDGNEVLSRSLRGVAVLLFAAAGIYGAIRTGDIARAYLGIIHKTLLVIVILSASMVAARALAGFANAYSRRIGGGFVSTSMFTNLTFVAVFAIGILIILQSLGISIAPLLTALGVGGLAVALALQDTLSNLFAGIHVIASKQIQPGEYIKLSSGEEGYVRDITWRYTTIQSLPGNMVIIPNSKLASSIVTNYYYPDREMSVLVEVGVSYDSDLDAVERETVDVAKEIMKTVQGGVPEHEPFIRCHTFGDSSINFTVILRGREFTDQYLIKHEFVKRLHARFRKAGIEIPFPIRTVYLKGDGAEPRSD